MIGDPDPYTAAMNALQYFHISEVVISTLPSNRSAWVEKGLVEKIEREQRQAGPARRGQGRGSRLMEAASVAGTHGSHAGVHDDAPPRPAGGQPLLARRAPAARHAAFHHLRGDGLRGLLHGLLLHPGRERRRVAGRGHRAAEADRRRQHVRSCSRPRSRCTGRSSAPSRATASGSRPGSSPRSGSARRSSSSRSTSTSTSASRPPTAPRRRSSTGSRACTARTCSSA